MRVCTRFLVADVDVQSQDYEQGDEGGPPVDDEHYDHAQHRPGQGHPLVVVLKARTPPCGETAEHSPGKWTHSSLKAHVRSVSVSSRARLGVPECLSINMLASWSPGGAITM